MLVAMAKTVTPEEAQALIASGQTYVDVRSEPEFEAGHPAGAVNVPLSRMGPGGFEPNAEFMTVMQRAFAKDAELVIGCKTGARSRRATAMLEGAGFTKLYDMVAGFAGSRDAFGRPSQGWTQKGLPVETGAPAGRGYEDVKKR
jgi:rhodanese-related sulfurtransferase